MNYSDKLSDCLCCTGEVHTIHKGGSHINLQELNIDPQTEIPDLTSNCYLKIAAVR
jgi:hypothetical protein